MPLDWSSPRSFLPSGPWVTLFSAGKNVRQVEHLELFDAERAELGERRRQHLHRAELERLQLLVVLVELRVRIDLNLDLAVGVLLGQFLEFQRAFALRRVGRHHVAELDDDRALRQRRRGERQRQGGAQNHCGFFHGLFHSHNSCCDDFNPSGCPGHSLQSSRTRRSRGELTLPGPRPRRC